MRNLLSTALSLLLLAAGTAQVCAEQVFSLDDAIEVGLLKNTQIRLAQARMHEVLGNIEARKAAFYPKVKVGGLLIPPTFIAGAGIPIYSARLAPSLEAFRLARSAAETNIRLAILDFVYKARLAYLAAQIAEKQVLAEYRNSQVFADLTARVTALTLSGLKGRYDVLAATVDLETTALRYEQAKLEAQRKRIDLFELVGLSPGHPAFSMRLQPTFPALPIPQGSLAELQHMAMERRVDLKLLRTLQMTDEQRVIIAHAAYFPEFAAISYNEIEANAPDFLDPLLESADPTRNPASIEDNPFNESKSKNYLQISWRVFDGFETHGKVVKERASVESRKAAADALEKAIPMQVMQAFEVRNGVLRLLEDLNTVQNENLQQNAQERLGAGFLSRLAYSDILVQQARFEFSKEQVRYQLARTNAQLQRALGLDVEFEDNPSAPEDKR